MDFEEKRIISGLIQAGACLLCAFVFAIIGISSALNIFGESPDTWFMRSGSMLVLFGVCAEYCLSAINGDINPTGVTVRQQENLSSKYSSLYKILKVLGVAMAVWGTFIWGYGDLVWLKLFA